MSVEETRDAIYKHSSFKRIQNLSSEYRLTLKTQFNGLADEKKLAILDISKNKNGLTQIEKDFVFVNMGWNNPQNPLLKIARETQFELLKLITDLSQVTDNLTLKEALKGVVFYVSEQNATTRTSESQYEHCMNMAYYHYSLNLIGCSEGLGGSFCYENAGIWFLIATVYAVWNV